MPFEKLPLQHAVLTGNCVRGSECELRFADGEVRHIAGNVDPLFAVDGSIRGSIGVFLDITRLRMLEQENRLLSREIAHRARNYVSLVQTLARQSLKSKLSRDDYDSFEARLVALGRSVTISLPGSEDAPTVELVVKASIEPLLGTASSRVEIQGPRVQLLPEDVTTLSMSVHELTTNACKYGALSNSQGRVSVSWVQPQGKDIVIIDWIERGGPPVVEPTRQGFGTKLPNDPVCVVGKRAAHGSRSWIQRTERLRLRLRARRLWGRSGMINIPVIYLMSIMCGPQTPCAVAGIWTYPDQATCQEAADRINQREPDKALCSGPYPPPKEKKP